MSDDGRNEKKRQGNVFAEPQAIGARGVPGDSDILVERRIFDVLTPFQWDLITRTLRLSHREREIATALLEGQKERSIAHTLGMSPHTVRTHLKRMYRKLQVTDRTELVTTIFLTYVALFGPRGGVTTAYPQEVSPG